MPPPAGFLPVDQVAPNAEPPAKDLSNAPKGFVPVDEGGGGSAEENYLSKFIKYNKLDEVASGAGDVLSKVPEGIAGMAHGLMPTKNIPVPGGQFVEDRGRNFVDKFTQAKDMATAGKYSTAARLLGESVPVVGEQIGQMSEYGSTHTPAQSVGALGTMYLLGKATEGVVGKLGEMPKPPASILGEAPSVRMAMSVLKPGNAVHALDDYPTVMARLKAENPNLGANPQNTIAETKAALDAAMTENRHYNVGHVGPIKATGMKVDLSPIADAIVDNITPRMEKNSPAIANRLRKIADRYRDSNSITELEDMLHESNAQASALRKLNPGEWARVTNAADSQAILDATNKAFRNTYYKALDQFQASPAVKMLNKEYGAMMGFRQDLEGVIQKALTSDVPTPTTLGQKAAKVIKAGVHPLKTAAGALAEAAEPQFDVADTQIKLAHAFKNFKGGAPPLPVPPNSIGRKLLPPATARLNPGQTPPAPQGPFPPGMGPSSAYPQNPQLALPAGTGKPPIPMPGQTYGPGGMGPSVSAEQVPPVPQQIHQNVRQLPEPETIPQGGFATGTTNRLVPYLDPSTKKIVYVPDWYLQKHTGKK